MDTRMNPIFIVGTPRSGTTLMTAFLSAHPKIAISPETHFFNFWLPNFQQREIYDFWHIFSNSKRFSYFGIEPEPVLSRALKHGKLNHQNIFEGLLEAYGMHQKKSRWGEKTPDHHQHLDQILNWYPKAKVVWMVRDPRSVVSSLLKSYWTNSLTSSNAGLWRQGIIELGKWENDERVKVVLYESLIQNTVPTLKNICVFLGEVYSQDMVDQRSTQNIPIVNRDRWTKQHLQKSLNPLEPASLHKWEKDLSQWQVGMIEYICRKEMKKYDYSFACDHLTFMTKYALKLEKRISDVTEKWRFLKPLIEPNSGDIQRRVHGVSADKA